MKYIVLFMLICSSTLCRPPHKLIQITHSASPLPPDVEWQVRIIALLQEQRKANVSLQDPTLIAVIDVLNKACAIVNSVHGNSTTNRIVIEDHDLARAIKYLDSESIKIKIL